MRTGYYSQGRQVRSGTVSGALAAVDTEISLAVSRVNPTKVGGTKAWLMQIKQMLDRFAQDDLAPKKKLPVEMDVPELLVKMGLRTIATELHCTIGDWMLVAY